jgi:acyl-coenzyme A thioesterase 9
MKAQKNIILQDRVDEDLPIMKKSYQNFKWMKNTIFKSVLTMHMQKRNVHGKIFGGYILRVAYDTAYIAAACFFGVENPVFVCVDDVQFVKPVAIGSIMEFTTTVAYNREDAIVIQVHAANVNYRTGHRTKTNILSYVFKHPQPSSPPYPSVMPNEYDEFILYLEGRRTMNKLTNTTENPKNMI